MSGDDRRARPVVRGWDGATKFTGLGNTRLKEMVEAGEFPAPFRPGERRVAWFEDEIRDWQDRVADRERGV